MLIKRELLQIPLNLLNNKELEYYKKTNTIIDEEIDINFSNREILFYKLDDNYIYIPREFKLLDIHNKMPISDKNQYHFWDFSSNSAETMKNFQLRDYQKEPVKIVLNNLNSRKSGILECPAGGGKTNMAIWITQQMNLKTLFICDSYELLEQAEERFFKFGKIKCNILSSARKEDNNSGVTLTLFQSLARNKKLLDEVKDNFGLVIVDECHISSARTYNEVLSNLQGLRLGLTATDKRKDELEYLYHRHIGKSLVTVKVDMLKCEVNWHITQLNDLKIQNNPFIASSSNSNAYYSAVEKFILNDESRNKLIVDKLEEYSNMNRKVLLITSKVSHINLLQKELLKRGIISSSLHSKLKKTKKCNEGKVYFNNFLEKKCNILLTVNKANKGLDVDFLDTLFLCWGGNNPVNWQQRCGRIQRFFAGKQNPLIIDFSDKYIPMLSKMAKNRSKYYYEKGFTQKLFKVG